MAKTNLVIKKTYRARATASGQVTSLALPGELVDRLREVSKQTGRTLLDVTGALIEYALDHVEVGD